MGVEFCVFLCVIRRIVHIDCIRMPGSVEKRKKKWHAFCSHIYTHQFFTARDEYEGWKKMKNCLDSSDEDVVWVT
uniref:Secreted protein n=1 Tax=Caenorhabditis tropicalis TaxID=1561998 RepID=A0A1I7TFL7_9PELO